MEKKELNHEKLTRLVNESMMTRLQVAEHLGISERTLYRWMLGERKFPRMALIVLESIIEKGV